MKKVLYATTALVLTAGVAAAEVRFSGDARMGLNYNSGGTAVAGGHTVRLEKRFTLNIDGRIETDGGVTLGARLRIRSDEVNAGNTAGPPGVATGLSGARVFASFAGLTVAAGNILGAIESMPNLYAPSVGLTGLGWHGIVTNVSAATEGDRHWAWDSFASRADGAEGIEVIYSMGAFALHASYSSDGLRNQLGTGQRTAVHGAYTFGGWTFAVGYQDATIHLAPDIDSVNADDKLVATVGGTVGNFNVALGYASNGAGANRIDKFAPVSYTHLTLPTN